MTKSLVEPFDALISAFFLFMKSKLSSDFATSFFVIPVSKKLFRFEKYAVAFLTNLTTVFSLHYICPVVPIYYH